MSTSRKLLAWLNDHGAWPEFRTMMILDRGDHGWVEFVTASGCELEAEVHRFYQRQGGYSLLLYALEATDFHAENLPRRQRAPGSDRPGGALSPHGQCRSGSRRVDG